MLVHENLGGGESSGDRPKETERQRELREIKERRERGEVYERPYATHIVIPVERRAPSSKDYGIWGEGGEGLIKCEFLTAGEKYAEDSDEYTNVYRQLDRVILFGGARSLTLKERMDGVERFVKFKTGDSLEEYCRKEAEEKGKSAAKKIVDNFMAKAESGKLNKIL